MAGQDFEVDHGALKAVAQQIGETTQGAKGTSIGGCVPAGQDLANDGLAKAVDEFRDRWERATASMIEDVGEMAKRVEGIAVRYATYESVVGQKVNALKGAMDSLSGVPLMGGVVMGVRYRGEPEFVIEGNPSGIRGRVASMKTCSEGFDRVGESLGGVETEYWVGKAADRFRSRLEGEPRRWTGVADGFRSAAAALEGYAAALEAAQQAARVCRENYEEGKRVSATAKADYDRDVSEGFQKKAAWEAQNGPGSYTLTVTPFTDPGQALRDGAVADFQAVIEELEKTGSDTEQAVAQAHADADPTRQWPNKAGTASLGVADQAPEDAKEDEERGKLDPAVKEERSKLSDEDRKKVLQAIVDEEFAKDGMEAPKISFKHEGKMEVMAHGMKAEFGELVES